VFDLLEHARVNRVNVELVFKVGFSQVNLCNQVEAKHLAIVYFPVAILFGVLID